MKTLIALVLIIIAVVCNASELEEQLNDLRMALEVADICETLKQPDVDNKLPTMTRTVRDKLCGTPDPVHECNCWEPPEWLNQENVHYSAQRC